ncbi:hypothetical protein HYV88_02155 [Candidatus Woesearchaeota archaeon]|nr:hypothetical protein [Candidatus Woesearchaeota archaeon]
MNKKGSEHVDWMVSMGIFLVALITIFLLLKPGIQKEGNESFLLNLLEEKFRTDFFLNVKKVPLAIGICESYDVGEGVERRPVEPIINLGVGMGWSLTQTQLIVKDVSKDIIDLGITKDPNWNGITCVSSSEAPSGGGCSNYNCHITSASTNNAFVYYLTYAQSNPVDFSIEDSSTSDCIIDSCNYRIGAIDNLYGLDTDNLNFKNFLSETEGKVSRNSEYKKSNIKTKWNFPENKDFFIRADDKGILEFNYETKKPEERDNVYVKTFRTNLIDKYGEVTPIVIYFGVW